MKLTPLILLMPVVAFAHPISQGALDVELSAGNLHVRARVPVEEIFLAGHAATPAEAWKEHGQYFLQHFQISADGRGLTGKVTGVTEVDAEHVVYDFDYALPAMPTQLSLRQNLLNELLYAPGNSWEATFVVRASEQ